MWKKSSIIGLVDEMLADAIANRASDIHLEPTADGLRVRWRIDGVLYDKGLIELEYMAQVISRLKVLAHIDIAEKRIPQDGKCTITYEGRCIDARVSTFPAVYGQKMVIRILDQANTCIDLAHLGFEPDMLEKFKQLIFKSSGFFLVSGPTGSGKTTTLYAALSALHAPEKHIITLEDPVEYYVQGVTQGHVRPDIGFTFAMGVRALLRQDPDIVMIGEIRDRETAQVAIEAALTGHVVLSTIHTNDAPSVIMRLMDMGIEPFLINAAVSGVLAQRLARTICPACKVTAEPTAQESAVLARLNISPMMLSRGTGCAECAGTGYKGRTGIFELLVMTPELRAQITQAPHIDAIVQQVAADGWEPLMVDGIKKLAQGRISLAELMRVLN